MKTPIALNSSLLLALVSVVVVVREVEGGVP